MFPTLLTKTLHQYISSYSLGKEVRWSMWRIRHSEEKTDPTENLSQLWAYLLQTQVACLPQSLWLISDKRWIPVRNKHKRSEVQNRSHVSKDTELVRDKITTYCIHQAWNPQCWDKWICIVIIVSRVVPNIYTEAILCCAQEVITCRNEGDHKVCQYHLCMNDLFCVILYQKLIYSIIVNKVTDYIDSIQGSIGSWAVIFYFFCKLSLTYEVLQNSHIKEL